MTPRRQRVHTRKYNGKSVKKFPGVSDFGAHTKFAKRAASRKVRRYKKGLGTGHATWKRLFQQYDICDYNYRYYTDQQLMDDQREYWDPKDRHSNWWRDYVRKKFQGKSIDELVIKGFWKYKRK